jgi:general secretion pathway protein A
VQLTGEVGTGKTTLVRTLLQNRLPDNADVAVVLNPQLSANEFLATIVEELGVNEPVDANSVKSLTDALNRYLLRAHADGRRVILIVDEAQNLAPSVLEQVRLLTNLETSKQKLLQIILIGQPELRDLLSRNDLRQLAQRITGRYHLEPLSREATADYVRHRLRVAGALTDIFEPAALKTVFRLTQGVPRLVNVVCDRALLGAYAKERRRVSAAIVRRAAAEISGEDRIPFSRRWPYALPALGTAVVLAIGLAAGLYVNPAMLRIETPETALPATVTPAPLPAAAAVERSEPPEPTLRDALRIAKDLTDPGAALETLLAHWGIESAADCDALSALGYACHRSRGSFGNLRQLDRPAVLELIDENGTSHHVVVTALGRERAELSMGGVSTTFAIADVAELWFGEFTMLWQPPNGRSVSLLPGVDDPNVVWLRESLSAIDLRYTAEPLDSTVYDAGLEARVMTFQRDHRLDVDGYAGEQTQIIIRGLLDDGGSPRLDAPQLARD